MKKTAWNFQLNTEKSPVCSSKNNKYYKYMHENIIAADGEYYYKKWLSLLFLTHTRL